jgi:hypothetical protein
MSLAWRSVAGVTRCVLDSLMFAGRQLLDQQSGMTGVGAAGQVQQCAERWHVVGDGS